jgi:putative addiction module antidote
MVRKICHIGNSQGILIPKEMLKKLNLATGSQVEVKLDEDAEKIIIEPAKAKTAYKIIEPEFAVQVKDFIQQYKPALKALAKK